jgi:hypothetical protein
VNLSICDKIEMMCWSKTKSILKALAGLSSMILLLMLSQGALAFFNLSLLGKKETVQCNTAPSVFAHTGAAQAYAVPDGCNRLVVKIWGAGGGGRSTSSGGAVGGAGGFASGTLQVSSSDTLTIIVGGGGLHGRTSIHGTSAGSGGFGGGGRALYGPNQSDASGGGGGLSGIFSGSTGLTFDSSGQARSLIIAGGGGGGSYYGTSGGPGGGLAGGDDGNATGGTQTAGGVATPGFEGQTGVNGSALKGGDSSQDVSTGLAGGGGGAGYFGGAGNAPEQNGAGGSGYCHPTLISSCVLTSGSVATPPNTGDADYAAGVGTGGGVDTNGGHGLVVIVPSSSP